MKFVMLMLLVLIGLPGIGLSSQGQEELKYEVDVKAKTIPVFAADAKGNPVYDIKKEDIQLFINGKPTEFEFLRYQFEEQEEKVKKLKTQREHRVIFIIIDSMFNSKEGFIISKKIVKEFVQKRFVGNRFVVIENSAWGGLRYLVGPERNENKIMTAMEKLKWYPEKKRKLLFMTPQDTFAPLLISFYMDVAFSSPGTSPIGGFDPNWKKKKKQMENIRFRRKAKLFSEALAQFKYVLQSIADPTMVFLISEGFSKEKGVTTFKRKYDVKSMSLKGRFREFSLYYLHSIIDGINSGGSVLYTINPQLTNPAAAGETAQKLTDGGTLSMRYAAETGGGKYFEGDNVESIVKEIKKYTAAYYELGVSLTPEMGERQDIQIKCNRKGIKLHTIRQSERAKPYKKMTKTEKKLFAYNAASGGTWSRITGKVKQADYKIENLLEKNLKILDIEIPGNMRNRKVDLFLLQFDPKTQDLIIDLKSRTTKEREKIEFKAKSDKEHYFVIIEPLKTLCIYGDEKNIGEKSDDAYEQPGYYSANTSNAVMTTAGKLAIAAGWDSGDGITLNGEMIYRPENSSMSIEKLFRTGSGDVVRFKESLSYRFIILKPDGTYEITGEYQKESRVTSEKGEIKINKKSIGEVIKSGQTSLLLKSFYTFFDRFKADEEFQLSRVTFPFKRQRFNPDDGHLLSSTDVLKSGWEFVTFEDSEDYAWAEPEIRENETTIRLAGKGLHLVVVFKQVNGKWYLTHSEDRSR